MTRSRLPLLLALALVIGACDDDNGDALLRLRT